MKYLILAVVVLTWLPQDAEEESFADRAFMILEKERELKTRNVRINRVADLVHRTLSERSAFALRNSFDLGVGKEQFQSLQRVGQHQPTAMMVDLGVC